MIKYYGDGAIFLQLFTSKWWLLLWSDWRKASWSLLRDFMRLNTAILAFIPNSIFRYKFGSQSVGFTLFVLGLLLLIGLNSTYLTQWLKPLSPWLTPYLMYEYFDQDIEAFFYVEIVSQPLFYFMMVYCLCALMHCLMIYLGYGHEDSKIRGTSWLTLLFSQWMKVNDYFIKGGIETLVTSGAGVFFWLEGDFLFGGFLMSCALANFIQETVDFTYKKKIEAMSRV